LLRDHLQLILLLGAESDWLQTRAAMHRQSSVNSPERKLRFDREMRNPFKELLTQRGATAVP
jgi:hypothetical protein